MKKRMLRIFCMLSVAALLTTACGLAEAFEAFPEEIREFELEYAEFDASAEELPLMAAAVDAVVAQPLEGDAVVMGVKQKVTLDISGLEDIKKRSFKSSNGKVASVNKKGVVTAKKAGETRITCYSGKEPVATWRVSVLPAPKKVNLPFKTLSLGVGESLQLIPSIPEGTLATFNWSSGNKKIVSVSKEGVIKGKKPGKATVTVKAQNGAKAKVKVTVIAMSAPTSTPAPTAAPTATPAPTAAPTATPAPTAIPTATPTIAPAFTATPVPTENPEVKHAMRMTINDTPVTVAWESNPSVEALRTLAKDGLTIRMSMYGGFEQVGPIGQRLPSSDKQTKTSWGDIVLYSSNQLVVFYGSNSWAYTRLGHITDKSRDEIKQLLGNGNVTIKLYEE